MVKRQVLVIVYTNKNLSCVANIIEIDSKCYLTINLISDIDVEYLHLSESPVSITEIRLENHNVYCKVLNLCFHARGFVDVSQCTYAGGSVKYYT
jgi:hypothetical protein